VPFADPDDVNATIVRLGRQAAALRGTLEQPATQRQLHALLTQLDQQITVLHQITPHAMRGLQQLVDASAPLLGRAGYAPVALMEPAVRTLPPRVMPALAAPTHHGAEVVWSFHDRAHDHQALLVLLERLLAMGHLPEPIYIRIRKEVIAFSTNDQGARLYAADNHSLRTACRALQDDAAVHALALLDRLALGVE